MSATPASTSVARSERLVSSHGYLDQAQQEHEGPHGITPASPDSWSQEDPGIRRASASTLEADLRTFDGDKSAKARKVGELVADRAKKAGVEAVVFDRGGNKFAGRVAAVAEGAREGGLDL